MGQTVQPVLLCSNVSLTGLSQYDINKLIQCTSDEMYEAEPKVPSF